MKKGFVIPMLTALLALPAAANEGVVMPVGHHDKHGDCGAPCEHKVCKPVPEKKRVVKVVYDCKDVDFCLPKCPLISFNMPAKKKKDCCDPCAPARSASKCDDQGCQDCEKPRCRKVLIKRLVTEEVDSHRCDVVLEAKPVVICPEPCPQKCEPCPQPCDPCAKPKKSLFSKKSRDGCHGGEVIIAPSTGPELLPPPKP